LAPLPLEFPMSFSHFYTAILLALASNLDNVGVGVAYGMRKVRVPFTSNLLIAAITASGTLLSMLFGNTIGKLLSGGLASVLAGGVLIVMGTWVVVREALSLSRRNLQQQTLLPASPPGDTSYLDKLQTIRINPLSADVDQSGQIDYREAALLGLALTPNNLVNGAAAGIIDLSIAAVVILVFLLSMATIWAGICVGHQCGKRWLGNIAGVASGALLIFVGTCEIVI
jgi:putative sporulation protein YtaF